MTEYYRFGGPESNRFDFRRYSCADSETSTPSDILCGREGSLKTRYFERWALEVRLADELLLTAVSEMEHGLIDGDLGGGLIKKRIRVPGRGKRGGARVVLATNRQDRWIFVFGFLKNQRDNISPRGLKALRGLAGDLLSLTERQLDAQTESGALAEIV